MKRRFFGPACAATSLLLFSLLSLLSQPVRGDRVVLTNGNYLEGSAEVLEDGSVAITSAMGTWTVAADRVARVERSKTAEEHVEEVLGETDVLEASTLYDLASWCREQGAATLARQLAERAIELDPEYEPARRLLGHRLYDGRWITAEEWRRLTEAQRRLEARTERALALREAQERMRYESARLELAAELARQTVQEPPGVPLEQTYGFPIGWVLSAPAVLPESKPRQAPPRVRRPSPRGAPPAADRSPPPTNNRSSLRPPG
jgi:tetratricopeptide (TPR) repeat protein